MVLLSCVLSGAGTFLLARQLGISTAGAFAAGVIFAFAPPRFTRLAQLHLATVQWIPFCLAFVHAYLQARPPAGPARRRSPSSRCSRSPAATAACSCSSRSWRSASTSSPAAASRPCGRSCATWASSACCCSPSTCRSWCRTSACSASWACAARSAPSTTGSRTPRASWPRRRTWTRRCCRSSPSLATRRGRRQGLHVPRLAAAAAHGRARAAASHARGRRSRRASRRVRRAASASTGCSPCCRSGRASGPPFGLYAALYRLLPGFDLIRVPSRLAILTLLARRDPRGSRSRASRGTGAARELRSPQGSCWCCCWRASSRSFR